MPIENPMGGFGASAPLADASDVLADQSVASDAVPNYSSAPENQSFDPSSGPEPEPQVGAATAPVSVPMSTQPAYEPGNQVEFIRGEFANANAPRRVVYHGPGVARSFQTQITSNAPVSKQTARDLQDADESLAKQGMQNAMDETTPQRFAAGRLGELEPTTSDLEAERTMQREQELQRHQQVQQEVGSLLRRARETHPDQLRMFRSQGGALGFGIGMILGGFAQAAGNAAGIPNDGGMGFINQLIDRDMQDQQRDLENTYDQVRGQDTLLGMFERETGDRDAAIALTKAAMLEKVKTQIQASIYGNASTVARNAAQTALLGLDRDILAARAAAEQARSRTVQTIRSTPGGNNFRQVLPFLTAIGQAGARQESLRYNAAQHGLGGPAPQGAVIGGVTFGGPGREHFDRAGQSPSVQQGMIANALTAQRVHSEFQRLANLTRQVVEHGYPDDGGHTRSELNSLRGSLMFAYQHQMDNSVLRDSEKELMNTILGPDAGDFVNFERMFSRPERILGAIDSAANVIRHTRDTAFATSGATEGAPGQAPGAAPDPNSFPDSP